MNLHLVHIKTCFQGIELIKSRIKLILTLMVNIIFLVSLAECLSFKKSQSAIIQSQCSGNTASYHRIFHLNL